MVDYFALALSHGLLAWMAWQLLSRADLDCDPDQSGPPSADVVAQEAPAKPKLPELRTRA